MSVLKYTIVAGLFWGLFLMTVSGETVPCIDTQAKCIENGFSSISVINNNYRCCRPGYSMSVINTQCFCMRTSQAINCSKGPRACLNAPSKSSDGLGNTLCCPQGYGLHTQMTSLNGMTSRSCTCTKGFSGGGGSFQMSMANGSNNFNATALTERLQNWQQRFHSSLSQGMGRLFGTMQAVRHHMTGIGNHMSNLFNTVFRG